MKLSAVKDLVNIRLDNLEKKRDTLVDELGDIGAGCEDEVENLNEEIWYNNQTMERIEWIEKYLQNFNS